MLLLIKGNTSDDQLTTAEQMLSNHRWDYVYQFLHDPDIPNGSYVEIDDRGGTSTRVYPNTTPYATKLWGSMPPKALVECPDCQKTIRNYSWFSHQQSMSHKLMCHSSVADEFHSHG